MFKASILLPVDAVQSTAQGPEGKVPCRSAMYTMDAESAEPTTTMMQSVWCDAARPSKAQQQQQEQGSVTSKWLMVVMLGV